MAHTFSAGTKIAQEKAGLTALMRPGGDPLYVNSDSGQDGYDGSSPRRALLTLTQAVALANAGDTIFLNPGGSETITAAIAVALEDLKIICPVLNPMSGFILSAAGTLDHISVTAPDVEIFGIHFMHTGATADDACVKGSAAAHRLHVHGCACDNIAIVTTKTGVGVEVTAGADDVIVEHNLFLDVLYGFQLAAASTAVSDRPICRFNTFLIGLSEGFGVHMAAATGKVQGPQVYGNIFIEADGDGTAASNAWDGTNGENGTQGPILMGAAVDQYYVADNKAHTDSAYSFDLLNAINSGADGSMVGNKSGSGGDVEDKVDVIDGVVDAILVDTGTTIPATIVTIDGYHDVATADAATNAVMSDVIGNKTDAAVQGATTTKTIMAYSKAILDILAGATGIVAFPAAAAAANDVSLAEVVRHIQEVLLGAQNQAGVQTVGTTTPSMGYIKAILDILSGTTGITTWPAAVAPGDGVSLAEGVRHMSEIQGWRTVPKTTVDLSSGTADNLFTITGEVECYFIANVTTAITRAGGAVTMEIGTSDDTDLGMAQVTDCRASIGDMFGGTDAAANINTKGSNVVISGGTTTATVLLTTSIVCDAGEVSVFCVYRPLSSDGAVVAA